MARPHRGARTAFGVLAGAAIATLAVACSSEGASTPATTQSGEAVVLTVTRDGDTLEAWTLDALLALPQQDVEIDGDRQTGPLLRDVIEASNAGGWAHATVHGVGEARAFDIELGIESDSAAGYVLDITRRGTAKLAGPDLPRERWVRDVTEIRLDE